MLPGLEEMTYEDDDYDDFWENYQDTRLLQPINPPECPTLNFKPATRYVHAHPYWALQASDFVDFSQIDSLLGFTIE